MWLEKSIMGIFVTPTTELFNCLASSTLPSEAVECTLVSSYTLTFTLMLGVSLFCFLASILTGNDSWVDRLWSIIPVVHAWIFALFKPQQHSLVPDDILKLMGHQKIIPEDIKVFGHEITGPIMLACCTTIWGIRLTFNFWRRGGYTAGGEDYRWEHVRSWKVMQIQAVWLAFSFFFISFFQMLLLWLIVVPMVVVPHHHPSTVELFIGVMYLLLVLFETIADQQQWNFQNEKRGNAGFTKRPHLADDYKRGYLTSGLFARSRHPNVWAEQQIWIIFFGCSFVYTGGLNASGIGALILVLLTVSSSNLTEKLSTAKYPSYRIYASVTPMLVPALFSPKKKLEEKYAKIFGQREEDPLPKKKTV